MQVAVTSLPERVRKTDGEFLVSGGIPTKRVEGDFHGAVVREQFSFLKKRREKHFDNSCPTVKLAVTKRNSGR